MKKLFRSVALASFMGLVVGAEPEFKVTSVSAGTIRLGMTVAQVRKALPHYRLSSTADGDGVPLVAVAKGKTTLGYLYAGDNRNGKISSIEVVDRGYSTVEGIHPQMLVKDVEQKWGKLKSIQLSEIESREFATFTRSPEGIGVRVQGTSGFAGDYARDEPRTARYHSGASVYSLLIQKP